ncbi:MAG: hypothetical protein QOG41_2127 [Thermoleophilaceae bacterium]|jgi:hypothetical protein|nr:hypothetical protein [Thermoleophilaceae bacterium]
MAVAALGALVVAGSLFVWIGLPLLDLKAIGAITARPSQVVILAIGAIPISMVGFGWLLYRINGLYEELRGVEPRQDLAHTTWLRSVSDDRRRRRAPRRLIDIAMTASAWTAVVLMAVWFFAFAEMHLVTW